MLCSTTYLDKAIINVKQPRISVKMAKAGKVNDAKSSKCNLKNTNNVAPKNMTKLLKMAKIEDKMRTLIKDEVDLGMMLQIIRLTQLALITHR